MKTLAFVMIATALAACSDYPTIDPGGNCAEVCAPYGVCSYSGGNQNSAGSCTCKDKSGECPGDSPASGTPADGGAPRDAGGQ